MIFLQFMYFQFRRYTKCFLQNIHLKVFSPAWVCKCISNWEDTENTFSQIIHWKGFSQKLRRYNKELFTDYIFLIFSSMSLNVRSEIENCRNAFSQRLHLYGFSPVWVLSCILKSEDTVNAFLHSTHLNGLSLLCVYWFTFNREYIGMDWRMNEFTDVPFPDKI